MSSRNASRRPADKLKAAEAARPIAAITEEYGQLVSRVGGLQYQVFVYEDEIAKINARLIEINHEAAARQALDKTAAVDLAVTPAKEEA